MDLHPLKDLSEYFLSQKNLSKVTIKNYRICYKYYIRYLEEHHILYAKTSDVIGFRDGLRKRGFSTSYIYIYISSLKSLYSYLRVHQLRLNLAIEYAHDIMIPIKNEKVNRNLKKPILTLEEARHLLIYTKKNRKIIYDFRNYAIICLMLTAGLSPYEIIHLKKEDYHTVNDKVFLHIKKRNHTQVDTVLLSKGVIEAVDDYLKRRRKKDNPYLFISQNQTTEEGHLSRTFFYFFFKKVIKKCGLSYTHITPHSLRHTAAYLNLLRGGTIESTKKLLRHIEMSSTLMYQDYIDKLNDHNEKAIEAFILEESSVHYFDDDSMTSL